MKLQKKWIEEIHIEQLISMIDSTDPAAPVLSALSSFAAIGKNSTVGNEVAFLIEGYRKNKYPPEHCSIKYGKKDGFQPDINEIKNWWEEKKEFNESGRAKAIEKETDLWQIYDNPELGISFRESYAH